MTTTWTTSLRLEKQGTGDNSNTWGQRLNLGLIDLVDAAVAGARSLVLAGNYSLTTADGGDDDARNAMLLFTGSAGAVNVTMPTAAKMYLVRNANSGVVTMKMAAGGTVAVPVNATRWVYSDATDVKDALADYLLTTTATTTFQGLSTALTAYAGLATTGFDVRTGATTVVSRSLTAPATGFTITNSDGVSGNPTFVLANDLAAVEGISTAGIVTRTASETWTTRTITGTAAEITVTNGDGVSGAPTLSLPAALTFTGKTITGGTFASPTLSGTLTGGTVNPTTLQQNSVALATAAFQATGTSGATLPFLNGANTWSGVQTYSAVPANWAKGTTIASATTTDIGAALGNYVQISGTTTITGLGTIQAGTLRVLEFQGALTLTHNASSLILPGGANITTAAGDMAVMVSEGSGNWRCVSYTTAAQPITPVLTKTFLSSGITITSAGTPAAIPHSLGMAPKFVTGVLHNTSTELGYSSGDEVPIGLGGYLTNAGSSLGVAVVSDATNLNLTFGGGGSVFAVVNKSSGTVSGIDNTKWTLILRAWA